MQETPRSHDYLTGPEAQQLFRYANAAAFYEFVRRSGVPFVKLNGRRCLFPVAAVQAWISSHTVGETQTLHENLR
jgi:hypothetical protein